MMSDSATNENLRAGRRERGDFGKDKGVGMKKGWQTKTIGDVCEVIAGQSPEGKFYNAEGKGMPFYQGKKDFGDKFIEAPTTWTTQTTKIAKEGDILMSVRAPVGPVNFATDEVCIGRGLAAIRSSDELNRDFLFYQLWHLQPEIAGREGAVFASINKAEIEALPLAYAPLAEQKRIVGLLDEAFEGLATAKANAEKNLQNARALFESHLQSVFTQRGSGWVEKPLGEVADLLDCLHKTPTYAETGYPMVRVTDIKPGLLDLSKTRKVDEQTFIAFSKGRTPRAGDIVFSRVGSCGVSALVSSDEPFCLGQNTVFILPKMNSMLLYHFLNSPNAKEQFEGFIDGTTQPTISMKSIRQVVVPIAPPAEHSRLVASLDSMREETHRLARLYEQKLAALESLKKSLLHQAFTGEL
jgi:type I restriction enzyme S subunit